MEEKNLLKKEEEKDTKKEGNFSKLFLGIVVGGAVGSVVGVTLSDKERRKKIKDTSVKAFDSGKKFFSDYQKSRNDKKNDKNSDKKTGFWFFLNTLFHGKKK